MACSDGHRMDVRSVSWLMVVLLCCGDFWKVASQTQDCSSCTVQSLACDGYDDQCRNQSMQALRTALLQSEAASFNGMSYLKLRPRTGESTLETLELSFATAKHGGLLVFLTGNQGNLLVQLHHGRIEIKALHDGQSFSIMSHGSNFNDSHWHKVSLSLSSESQVAILHVDGSAQGVGYGWPSLSLDGSAHVGGVENFGNHLYLGGHYFRGCMAELNIETTAGQHKPLSPASPSPESFGWPTHVTHAQGVRRGCFSDVADDAHSSPAFSLRRPHSHAHVASWSAGSSIKFHVRTAASDGLLLLAGAESSRNVQSQLNFIAVHVVMGRPHVIVRVSGEEFDMWGTSEINDGERWHTVSLKIDGGGLELKMDQQAAQLLIFPANDFGHHSGLYFGRRAEIVTALGVADRFPVSLLACVRRVSIAGLDINLSDLLRQATVSAGCHWTNECGRGSVCRETGTCLSVADTHRCDCSECTATRDAVNLAFELTVTGTPSSVTEAALPADNAAISSEISIVSVPVQAKEGDLTLFTNFTLLLLAQSPYTISLSTGFLQGPGFPLSGVRLRVTVSTPPRHGTIHLKSSLPGDPSLQHFSYQQLVQQRIGYRHDGSESETDSFTMSVYTPGGDILVDRRVIVIKIELENDLPQRVNQTAVRIAVGSRVFLTPSMLYYTDGDGSPATTRFKWVNNSRSILPAQLEHYLNPGSPLSHFSQQDVNQRLVMVSHLGRASTEPFMFHFHVTDDQGAMVLSNVTVQPYLGTLHLVHNTALDSEYQKQVVITSSHLLAVASFDSQDPRPTVTFTVRNHPSSGVLALKSSTSGRLTELTSFTQANINASRVIFLHNTSKPASRDRFVFSISSGHFMLPDRDTFDISIALPPVSVRPRLMVSSSKLYIGEGRLVVLPPNVIQVGLVPSSASGGPFEISIQTPRDERHITILHKFTKATDRFRLADLAAGQVAAVHDDSEEPYVALAFCVSAVGDWPPEVYPPNKSCGHTLEVNVITRNDVRPKLVYMPQKEIRMPEGSWRVINNSMLLATDADTDADKLMYTVTSGPGNGYLALLPDRTTAVTTFSQQDIDDMRLLYQHVPSRGDSLGDSFYFTISDDGARGKLQSVQSITFEPLAISVNSAEQVPLRLSALSFSPNGVVADLTAQTFALYTDDPVQTNNVQLTITAAPKHGSIVFRQSSMTADQFTLADVVAGKLQYRLSSKFVQSRRDSFECLATIGRARKGGIAVSIEIEVRPMISAAVGDGLLVARQSTTQINEMDISVTYDSEMVTEAQVIAIVVSAPEHGQLLVNNEPVIVIVFSLADLRADHVAYRPTGSRFSNDSFSFYFTNGYRNTSLLHMPIVLFDQRIQLTVRDLLVEEGGRTVITAQNLLAVGPPLHTVTFTVNIGPHRGQIQLSGSSDNSSLLTFTSDQIERGLILYSHDGSELDSDFFNFTVALQSVDTSGNRIGSYTDTRDGQLVVRVTQKNDNKPKPVNPNATSTFSVVQFGHLRLTSEHLNYIDVDSDVNGQLLYTVYSGLKYGTLLLNGSPVRKFLQSDLDGDGIIYQHQTSDKVLPDFMAYYVSDENPANHFYSLLTFDIVPMNMAVDSDVLQVIEGKQRMITGEHLNVTSNLRHLHSRHVIFMLSALPEHGQILVDGLPLALSGNFTLTDAEHHLVAYQHDGSDTVTDILAVIPQYFGKTFQQHSIKILVQAVDDTPPAVLYRNKLEVDDGSVTRISSDMLSASDDEVDDYDVFFTLERQPSSGVLLRDGKTSLNFTQHDLDQGLVAYRHILGSHHHDSLLLSVTDGTNSIPNVTINIVIYPKAIPLSSEVLHVDEGKTVTVTTTIISINNPLFVASEVQLNFQHLPRHGKLLLSEDNTVVDVDTAVNASLLQRGMLQYKHDDSETRNDSFVVLASFRNKFSNPLKVEIRVNPVNDESPLSINLRSLAVWMSHDQTLTSSHILFTDKDTIPGEVRFVIQETISLGKFVSRKAGNGIAIKTFSQQDINDGDVVFVGKNITGKYDVVYSVSDGVESHSRIGVLRIQVVQLTLAAVLNKVVTVDAGGRTSLGSDIVNLSRTDMDTAFVDDVVFTNQPSNDSLRYGHLEIDNQHVSWFSYSDLLENKLVYIQSADEQWPPSDTLIVSVTATPEVAGIDEVRIPIKIRYRTDNGSALHANKPLNVDEGRSSSISPRCLQAGNLRARLAHDTGHSIDDYTIIYSVLQQPGHGIFVFIGKEMAGTLAEFQQSDIDAHLIEYVHDGTENFRDVALLEVRVLDVDSTVVASVHEELKIHVRPINDQRPEILKASEPLQVAVGATVPVPSSGFISVVDRDVPAAELTFMFPHIPAGVFLVDDVERSAFTQTQLSSQSVEFSAVNETGDHTVTCVVSDGLHNLTMSVKIAVSSQFLQLSGGAPLAIVQGSERSYLSEENIRVHTNIHPRDVRLEVITEPSHGHLLIETGVGDELAQVKFLSWEDIQAGRIVYKLHSFTSDEDRFTLQEAGDFNASDPVDVIMHVRALIEPPSKPVVLTGEDKMILTADMLNARRLAPDDYKSIAFAVTADPVHGDIQVGASGTRRRRATSPEFTFADVVNGEVYYAPRKDAPDSYEEGFDFTVDAPGVAPGKGQLSFHVQRSSPHNTSTASLGTTSATTTNELPAMKSDTDDEFLMQVIIPAAGGGFFVLLLIVTLFIVAYRSKKRQEKKVERQNNYRSRESGESTTSDASSTMSAQKAGAVRDDSILIQATPVSNASKTYVSTAASGPDSAIGTPGESPAAQHPSTLPRSWNSNAAHVVVTGRSNSDQEASTFDRVHGRGTPPQDFSGSRPVAQAPGSRNGSTSHYYKVSREDSMRYADGRPPPPHVDPEHINSHESLAAYDRVFDKIFEKRAGESPVQHDGRPTSAMTVLRKNEYWI